MNRDGAVTICDAVVILRHIQGVERLTTNQLALPLTDIDTNGVINFADVQRLIDMIVERVAVQDFDTNLLYYDDEDGFSYLEDWDNGTNPFLRDTDGNGIEDEVQVHSRGAVILAQPVVELYREFGEGGSGIVFAQPPVEIFRTESEGGTGVVIGQPPVEILRTESEGGTGVVIGQPPVKVTRDE